MKNSCGRCLCGPHPAESALLSRAKSHCRISLGKLVEHHLPCITKSLSRAFKTQVVTEDALSLTLVTLTEKIHQVQKSFCPWCRVTAYHNGVRLSKLKQVGSLDQPTYKDDPNSPTAADALPAEDDHIQNLIDQDVAPELARARTERWEDFCYFLPDGVHQLYKGIENDHLTTDALDTLTNSERRYKAHVVAFLAASELNFEDQAGLPTPLPFFRKEYLEKSSISNEQFAMKASREGVVIEIPGLDQLACDLDKIDTNQYPGLDSMTAREQKRLTKQLEGLSPTDYPAIKRSLEITACQNRAMRSLHLLNKAAFRWLLAD